LLNSDELEKAACELESWIERDRKRYVDEQSEATGRPGDVARGR
jgi:hypothetical protein